MFGKWFAQTYTGSMFGAGPSVFAVWGYVVAHVQFETVEINPDLLAAVLGDSLENIEKALQFLCAPDPESRTQIEQGRRLVREGQYLYRVPTARLYRSMRDEHDRRAYNRKKMAESRAKANSQNASTSETPVVCRRVPPCAGVCRCEPITENRPQSTDHRELKEPLFLKDSLSQDQSQKHIAGKFIKPSIEEVRMEVAARGNKIDADAFWHFYETKGWKVGNQSMQKWKSAIVTWEKRERRNAATKTAALPAVNTGLDMKRKAMERLK